MSLVADAQALFAAHQHRLYRYFCRAVGQTETARDLTQDVFVRVARAEVPPGGNDDVRGWLFRIARNLALDHHRQRARRPEAALPVRPPAHDASQDVTAAVNEALAALPDLDRDVFLMREVAGLGYDDIAKACDLTPAAVRSRIHRARLQLRDQLAAPITARRAQPMRRTARNE